MQISEKVFGDDLGLRNLDGLGGRYISLEMCKGTESVFCWRTELMDCGGAGCLALLFEVSLMVFFGFVEFRCGGDLRYD